MAALLAGAALIGTPPLAQAQPRAQAEAPGQDARDLDGEHGATRSFRGQVDGEAVLFTVSIPAEGAMRIDVISTSGLDPVVTVTDAASGELIAEDDDGGENLDSRVVVRGGDSGRRILIAVNGFAAATSDEASAGGSFELRLTTLDTRPQELRAVQWGSSLEGVLESGDTHEFSFSGEAGTILEVALIAGDGARNEAGNDAGLDPYLVLRDAAGEEILADDDGGEGLNALLRYLLPDDATYIIAASGYGNSSGAYRLRVGDRREPVVQAPLQVIGIDDPATGRLGAGYENGIEPDSIDYQLSEEAKAAIRGGLAGITIRMEAARGGEAALGSALDPYIELGFDTPLGFARVDGDDDGAGDLDALLPIDLSSLVGTPDLLDRLRIRALAYGGSAGAYRLQISEGMAPRERQFDGPIVPLGSE